MDFVGDWITGVASLKSQMKLLAVSSPWTDGEF